MRKLSHSFPSSAFGLVFSILFGITLTSGQNSTIFFEDFETGIGSWHADVGVWEVGIPTAGPSMAYTGQQLAGTALNGNYPGGANTRLISPGIALPAIGQNERLLLKFWHWFRFSDDIGQLQVSANGGEWQTINGINFDGYSTNWTQYVADLSAYTNATIRIAFFFNSGTYNVDSGWYIDDISIEKKVSVLLNPEDFELGTGDWSAENGLWAIGIPTAGPQQAHSGQMVAGTVLDGNYHGRANTRLVSPEIVLPSLGAGEKLLLKFWHWFRFSDDIGQLQVSVNGGEWQTINGINFDGYSTNWTQYVADLSAYTNATIRIAFFFNSGTYNVDSGWYIDDISIEKKVSVLLNPEDFELGTGDWSAENGLWAIGIPTAGPQQAHSGQMVAGTVLDGNYHGRANTRLISPEIEIIPQEGMVPTLFFWHWFRFSDDNGQVQISVDGGDWVTISATLFTGYSPNWTQYAVDLSAYTNSTVRLAFFFNSGTYNVDSGWYIDDIRIEGIRVSTDSREASRPQEAQLQQNHPNPFSSTTTISYQLANSNQVELAIYNSMGQKVAILANGNQPAGAYQIQWNGKDSRGISVPAGAYYYSLRAGRYLQTRKMFLVR